MVIDELQSFRIEVRAGEIAEIDPVATPFDFYDIQLAGADEQWNSLLAPIPPVFYQVTR